MSEDFLKIDNYRVSPVKTIEKKEIIDNKTFSNLTYSKILTSNQIFNLISLNNKEIIENLIEKNKINIINDKYCPYYKKNGNQFYNQRCKGCQIHYRLQKGSVPMSDFLEIFTGDKKGIKIEINKKNFFKEPKSKENKYLFYSNYIDNSLYNLMGFKPYNTTNLISLHNKNTNYVIQSILFNLIMKQENCSLTNDFIWSYVCGSNFKIFKNSSFITSIDKLITNPIFSSLNSPTFKKKEINGLSKTTIKFIIKQLTILFKILSKYKYVHSLPELSFINYSLEPAKLVYDNKIYEFPFSIILKNNFYSSIEYKNKRIFCENGENFFNNGLPFEKISIYTNGTNNQIINPFFPEKYNKNRIYGYKIGTKLINFTKTRNFYGVPLCHDSFDFVIFITNLFLNKNFHNFNNCQEFHFWKGLWKKEEFPLLIEELKKIDKPNYEKILNIVKKYYIRFDALDYFFDCYNN